MKLRPSLKARALVSVGLLALIFAFQNCGKAPLAMDTSGSDSSQQMKASQFSELVVDDENRDLLLNVDLNSGKIEQSSISNPQDISQKCLSEADQQKLDEILYDAQICAAYIAEGYCAQVFRPSYAALREGTQAVALGGGNGCHNNANLCGKKSTELILFLDELKVRVDSMNCN